MTTAKFEKGNIYAKSSIVDSQSKSPYICIGRTAKTVTFEKYIVFRYLAQRHPNT